MRVISTHIRQLRSAFIATMALTCQTSDDCETKKQRRRQQPQCGEDDGPRKQDRTKAPSPNCQKGFIWDITEKKVQERAINTQMIYIFNPSLWRQAPVLSSPTRLGAPSLALISHLTELV